jgi:hypothetical protein
VSRGAGFLAGSRRRTASVVVPGVLAAALFVGVIAYAFFTAGGTGTGTASVGTLLPPTVSPAGAPVFSAAHLVPGDSLSAPATVTANGGPPSRLSIYEQSASGTLVSQLTLKIVEDGSTVLYNGPLTSGPTSGSPLALPGTGTGGAWPAGEQHSFLFTVSFPSTAGNSFQSTNASVSFVWQRLLP